MSKDNNVFPLRPTPRHASDDTINSLFDYAAELMRTEATFLKAENALWQDGPVLPETVPELMFSTTKRHSYVFERVPYGRGMGWRCYDPNKYDGDPADGDTNCGYGKTEDEAYCDYIGFERPATAAERELDEAIDNGITFDDVLEDGDGR